MIKDKRGRGGFGFMTYITNALIFAIIIFIIFAIWGGSGGFGLIIDIGKLMAKIPAWVYLSIGGIWLLGKITGK